MRAFHVFLLKVSVGKIFPNRERSFLTGFFHLRNRSSRGRSVKKKEKKFAEVAPGGSSKPDLVLGKIVAIFIYFLSLIHLERVSPTSVRKSDEIMSEC